MEAKRAGRNMGEEEVRGGMFGGGNVKADGVTVVGIRSRGGRQVAGDVFRWSARGPARCRTRCSAVQQHQ